MTTLYTPGELQKWVDLIEDTLALEEVAEILGEIPSVIKLGGVAGYVYRYERGRAHREDHQSFPFNTRVWSNPIEDAKAFRKYLRIYHTEKELELFDAAWVSTQMSRQ